jgi:hypothetical protein
MARKTTKNRLADARDALDSVRLQIAALERKRRDVLLERDGGAADDEVERIEIKIEGMRRLAQRLADKVALLEPEVAREEHETRFPPNLDGALARLAALQRRRDALARKNRFDRSAAEDAEITGLGEEIETLARHIEQIQLMAGAA